MSKTQVAVVKEESAQKQVAEIHAQAAQQQAQMQEAGISLVDLEIPKLMLMQSTSELVGEEQAKFGEVVNTMNGEVVGSLTQPLELIPLKQFKTVRIYDMSGKQPKFMRVEEANEKNSSFDAREGNETGIPIKRVLNMNFFVLLKKEIDAGEAFPAVVSFKSTGLAAGKQLATQMFKMIQLDRMPYSKSVTLTVKKEKKDTNTYAVFSIEKGENCTPEVCAVSAKWLKALAAAKTVTVVEKEERDVESVEAPHVLSSTEVGGPY
jgi:hypothetical protein